MRRIIPISVALALAGTTLVAGSASSSTSAAAKAKPVRTGFALAAASFGTRVIGGALPVDSSQTGSISLSCTNKAPVGHRNFVAEVDVPDFGTLVGVSSRVWTEKVGSTVSSYSSHDIAHIRLFNSEMGSLDINGLSSLARAWHDTKGYHASIKSKIASITYTPTDGEPRGLEVPSIGKPLTIPGLLRISIGVGRRTVTASGAEGVTSALDIRVFPGGEDEVKAIVGQTKAIISGGIKSGIFGGVAIGAEAKVLGDLIEVGKTPLQFMPCPGTKGEPIVKEIAGVDLGPLKLSGLFAGVKGSQNNKKAVAMAAAHVASVNLGDGELVINGIRGVANVTRENNRVRSNADGTRVVEILHNGESRELLGDGLEIPGLAKLESKIIERTKNGIRVIALRITLLTGTLAVIDLGSATVGIKGAGRRRR